MSQKTKTESWLIIEWVGTPRESELIYHRCMHNRRVSWWTKRKSLLTIEWVDTPQELVDTLKEWAGWLIILYRESWYSKRKKIIMTSKMMDKLII